LSVRVPRPVHARSGRCPQAQRGVGLIEVMLATLILSIGLLASSRMQIGSLQANRDSHFIGQAGTLIDSAIDRMRSNPAGIAGGFYDAADTRESGSTTCLATACTPAELAMADIEHWRDRLVPVRGDVLPALPGPIDGSPAFGTIVAGADGVYTVTQTWGGTVDGEPGAQSLSTRFRP